MVISVNNNLTFTSKTARNGHIAIHQRQRSEKEKETEKKVVTGGGAVAATTAAARTKAAKSGLSMFDATSRMKNITNATKTASTVAKETKGLWAKVVENAKWAKNAVIGWGTKFQNWRAIKPLVNSTMFKFGAGALGYGFGFVTLISGLSDIGKVATEAIESQTKKD